MDKTSVINSSRLELRDLVVAYGNTTVISGLTLSVARGETIAVIGPSGCGKTTLLKAIALFVPPKSGTMRLDSRLYYGSSGVARKKRDVRRDLCLVFQDYSLFPNLTGLENITFAFTRLKGVPLCEARATARELASRFKLSEETLQRYPSSFSGGQAQRIALLRALILRPKVLLLDEITSALDPESIRAVVDTIRQIRTEPSVQGMAIVFVTHLMHFAAEFSDKVIYLSSGRLVEEIKADELINGTHSREVDAFVKHFRAAL